MHSVRSTRFLLGSSLAQKLFFTQLLTLTLLILTHPEYEKVNKEVYNTWLKIYVSILFGSQKNKKINKLEIFHSHF